MSILIGLSSALVFLCYILFIHAILKGKARPHRTTRLVLLVITLVATLSLFAQQNQVAIWLIGTSAVFSSIIFLLTLKYGMGGWAKIDIFCLIVALAGVVLWQITSNPTLALYISIAADFIAIIPTLIKTYKYPNTEVWYFYGLAGISALLNLAAIQKWTPEEYSYPLYLVLINIVLVGLILRPKLQSRTRRKTK